MTETSMFERTFALDDIAIRSGGDGRTVVAYAAVFGVSAEIRDFDGRYYEVIARSAFDRTLQQGIKGVSCFYNHSHLEDVEAMPVGAPLEIRPDGRGLLTVTRFARTAKAEECLQLIRDGAIRGMSFLGRTIRSRTIPPAMRGALATIERLELGLREYGPTPSPAYVDAEVVAVRHETTHEPAGPAAGPDPVVGLGLLHVHKLAQAHRRRTQGVPLP